MSRILIFSQAAERVVRFTQLVRLTIEALQEAGVTRISYYHRAPPGAADEQHFATVVLVGYPRPWLEIYSKKDFAKIDPVPSRAMHSCRPFLWKDTLADLHDQAGASDFVRALEDAKLIGGLIVPVYGPFGRNGYVGLNANNGSWPLGERETLYLQHVCQIAHLRYCEMITENLDPVPALSNREREILTWIAKGKSNAVIADIVELSPNTVDTYTRRIFRKLNVVDRVTASLRGYALGLLD